MPSKRQSCSTPRRPASKLARLRDEQGCPHSAAGALTPARSTGKDHAENLEVTLSLPPPTPTAWSPVKVAEEVDAVQNEVNTLTLDHSVATETLPTEPEKAKSDVTDDSYIDPVFEAEFERGRRITMQIIRMQRDADPNSTVPLIERGSPAAGPDVEYGHGLEPLEYYMALHQDLPEGQVMGWQYLAEGVVDEGYYEEIRKVRYSCDCCGPNRRFPLLPSGFMLPSFTSSEEEEAYFSPTVRRRGFDDDA